MTDLGSVGLGSAVACSAPSSPPSTLDNATAINDNGQIVANGYNATGQEHAFLLTPG